MRPRELHAIVAGDRIVDEMHRQAFSEAGHHDVLRRGADEHEWQRCGCRVGDGGVRPGVQPA